MLNKIAALCVLLQNTSRNGFYVMWDFFALHKARKLSIQEYVNYGFDRCDRNFKESFLPYAQAKKYWKILNPERYGSLARNKYLSHLILEKAGIPTPELIAYYNPENTVADADVAVDYKTLATILKNKKISTFVLKPAVDGAHGQGVVICRELTETDGELYLKKYDGEQIPLRDCLKAEPLLLEKVVIQTAQMASFNPSSVNTVRVMTALYPNQEVKVIATFLKIGRSGSDIDNAGGGGNVDAACRIENGELYNVMQFDSWKKHEYIDSHPDTGVTLVGVKIDDWKSIIEKVKDFQGRIPLLKAIGWDIAVTENGPVVIEINNYWDTTGQLFIGQGWKEEVAACYSSWEKYYDRNKNEAD